jgi:hypothetical protein
MARAPVATKASTSSIGGAGPRAVAFGDVDRASWNCAADASAEAWLFHRHEWIVLEEAHGGTRRNLSFALLSERGAVAGIQPLYLRENGLGSWIERCVDSGLHRHTGLALVDGLDADTVTTARRTAMAEVERLAGGIRADRIQLNVQNLAPARLRGQGLDVPFWVLEFGYEPGVQFGPNGILPAPGRSTRCEDQIVTLEARSEEDLFEGLEPAARRAVRKALRASLTAHLDEGGEAVDDYQGLARLSAQRTGEAPRPPGFFAALYAALRPAGRCRILFARHGGRPVGGLVLLIDKGSVHFLAGASDPGALPMRVNDFLHWSAIQWARRQGYGQYRLGPTFPELPADWPVARVSRFKGKFGGRGVALLQGSRFLHPERYALQGAAVRGAAVVHAPASEPFVWLGTEDREGLEIVLSSHGMPRGGSALPAAGFRILLAWGAGADLPVSMQEAAAGVAYHPADRRRFRLRAPVPAYHAVLRHRTFGGDGLRPVWVDGSGRAALAWLEAADGRKLLVGLDVVNEVVRHRQGDPERVELDVRKAALGFQFERPLYLFEAQLLPGHRTQPWADRLGYLLAEAWSRATGAPLLEPLPGGVRGAVILTGDDDQAFLDKYAEQLRLIGGLPITYMLHPLTRHTSATLAALGPGVQLGLHPDALDCPDDYDRCCGEQASLIRARSGRPLRTVRNHGYLNRGYLGHLSAWESAGLDLDVNLPGLDGTALNGSFLPMPVRRPDGGWSSHYSLLTAFGDGMVFALGLRDAQAAQRVRRLARQVEGDRPGVLVFNLHPQNVRETRKLHAEAVALAGRPGWIAIGLESYLDWLQVLRGVEVQRRGQGLELTSRVPVANLVLRWPDGEGWRQQPLPPWSGRLEVAAP